MRLRGSPPIIPAVQHVSSSPRPQLPWPSPAAKKTSALIDADIASSDPTSAATAILSVRSPAISAIPSRARGFAAPNSRPAPHAQRESGDRDDGEARRVEEQRGADARGGHAARAREWPERVAEVAGGLDSGVDGACARPCGGDRAHEGELRRDGDGRPGAEQRHEREHARGRRRGGERDGDRGLGERGDYEQLASVESVGERAAPGSAEREREPVRGEQSGDRDPRAGLTLEVHGQRGHGREVSRRRDERGGGEETEVAAMGHGRSS